MLLIELSMSPLGAGESVSADVARAVTIIEKSGLPYKLGPMGTCIEGEYDEVMRVVKACLDDMASRNKRVTFSIKADYREGAAGRLESKVQAVVEKAGRPLKT
jgi:uncharacterized protein (TIGR00106 family)